MSRYLISRFLLLIPTLFLASILIFAIITLSPGDPAQIRLGTEATEEQIAAERERLGLDEPIPVRYAVWVTDVMRFDLGRSLVNNRPAAELVAAAFPNTLRLVLLALALSLLIGIPMGIIAAVRQNSPLDLAITGMSSLGLAVPSFWLGIMLILVLSVRYRWLPPSGAGDPDEFFISNIKFLIMPVITIAVSNIAVFSRFIRSAMIDTLATDYVRTARAKGLPERIVLTQHALRNALLPTVTVLGIQFGRLLGGAVVTESVFSYPGIGRLVISSILNRDYPVVQATLMFVVLVFLVMNLLVDLSYAYLDPTVKFDGR